eukprot:9337866-Ditylum_brightwellii.AAC.1
MPKSPPPKEKNLRWASPITKTRGKSPSNGKRNNGNLQQKQQENCGGANNKWGKGKQKPNGRRSYTEKWNMRLTTS